MKVIFLDIDGVLVNRDSLTEAHKSGVEKSWLQRSADQLNKKLIENLNLVVEKTGAKIVISSSWRILHSQTEIRQMLRESGLKENCVIGVTPVIREMGKKRGDEIQEWKDSWESIHRYEVTSFVIVDDDSDMVHLKPRLVQTNFDDGLTLDKAEKMIEMLNEKDT